jgi:hypothetical protein
MTQNKNQKTRKIVKHIFIFSHLLLFLACGEGIITVDQEKYEEKIVIEGYLYPHQAVNDIRISRNLPLNTNLTRKTLYIPDAVVQITDLQNGAGIPYLLTYNPDSGFYQYDGSDLVIEYGGKYQLNVEANIEGKTLQASSVTRVPLEGFKIMDHASTESMYFYETSDNDVVLKPVVTFQRSAETDFYAFSIVSLDAAESNFIYTHPFGGDIKEEDVEEYFNEFRYSHDTMFNTPLIADQTSLEIEWIHIWFYGNYRIVAYAGDENFKNYYLTHAQVQEIDGNFHEPEFNIEGDGIGVFGSAIADTIYINILRD